MLECDICLTPCEPTMTMTLRAQDEATVIAACWECATAQLLFLTDRWREAIAEHNAAVGEMVRMFGLPELPPEELPEDLRGRIEVNREDPSRLVSRRRPHDREHHPLALDHRTAEWYTAKSRVVPEQGTKLQCWCGQLYTWEGSACPTCGRWPSRAAEQAAGMSTEDTDG